eukprot:32610-Eustigmatos_ZCMA.PRE.1
MSVGAPTPPVLIGGVNSSTVCAQTRTMTTHTEEEEEGKSTAHLTNSHAHEEEEEGHTACSGNTTATTADT